MASALKIGFAIAFLLQMVPILVWLERKLSAFMQGRVGPNRTSMFGLRLGGLFQSLADAVKFMFKEDIVPDGADRFLFRFAPLLVMVPPILGFVVIPFGNQIEGHHLQVADLGVGILLTMSVLSVGVYGLAFGGWASNNKYSLLGGLRASAQLISYEITLVLSIITVLMFAETVDPRAIVEQQTKGLLSWNIFGGGSLWLLPSGLLAFLLFFIAALAENNRLPFDMSECEAELVAGYHTEYSSMKFALFFMGEYVAMVLMCALMVTFFLGGWYFPWITDPGADSWAQGILSVGVFTAKTMVLLLLYIFIRWTLPRFKYNQLMDLGWKRLIPIALANVLVVAVVGVIQASKGNS